MIIIRVQWRHWEFPASEFEYLPEQEKDALAHYEELKREYSQMGDDVTIRYFKKTSTRYVVKLHLFDSANVDPEQEFDCYSEAVEFYDKLFKKYESDDSVFVTLVFREE